MCYPEAIINDPEMATVSWCDGDPRQMNDGSVKNILLSSFLKWDAMEDQSRKTGKSHSEKDRMNAATYLLESGYDMLLSSDHNVSESPGFEILNCQTGKGKSH